MRRFITFISIIGFAGLLFFAFSISAALASHPSGTSNIDFNEPNHWAWNDVLGWIDFCDVVPGGGDCVLPVLVSATKIAGYASSSVGFIELDCATTSETPSSICTVGNNGNWFVSNNGQGGLAGYAWNDAIGWISFCGNEFGGSVYNSGTWACPNNGSEVSFSYQVVINGNTGDFSGYAWNDVAGWISFNCGNAGAGCGIGYKVNTEWRAIPPILSLANLISSTFDTCATAPECGATPNSIVWQGTVPTGNPGNYVGFQIASDCIP
ncbi:MAG: hypothetical protein AAB518_01475, partial [Patescibacteria group bacterium]